MELTKKHEQYVFKDTHERGWIATGNVTTELNNVISLWISIVDESEKSVGNINYTKLADNTITFNLGCSEEDRKTLAAYADTLIGFVLDYFKNPKIEK